MQRLFVITLLLVLVSFVCAECQCKTTGTCNCAPGTCNCEHCSHHGNGHHHITESLSSFFPYYGHLLVNITGTSPFFLALGASVLVSVLPLTLMSLLPFHSLQQPRRLSMALAGAAGALMGDVFLHVWPHLTMAVMSAADAKSHNHHEHEHEHHHHDESESRLRWLGLMLCVAFSFFAFVDGLVSHNHSHQHHHHSDEVTSTPAEKERSRSRSKTRLAKEKLVKETQKEAENNSILVPLVLDAIHNFTDGIAIAAAFATSPRLGITSTIAIACHELPHELVDLILLSRGRSIWAAYRLQLVTAVASFIGVFIYFAMRTLVPQNNTFIHSQAWWDVTGVAMTSGGFLYVACVHVLGETKRLMAQRPAAHSLWERIQLLLDVPIAMMTGMLIMYVVALLE